MWSLPRRREFPRLLWSVLLKGLRWVAPPHGAGRVRALGVEEIYAVGGAQAVAMLAYGVDLPGGDTCEPVDLVTGPGNIYVTAAKRALQGIIGIDSEAGPTEVAILADDSADARYVAADLISQAEHDVIAAAVLVTSSERLANEVEREVRRRWPAPSMSSASLKR